MMILPDYFDVWLRMGGRHFRFGTFLNALQVPAMGTSFSCKNGQIRQKLGVMRSQRAYDCPLKDRILRGRIDLLVTPLTSRFASLTPLVTEYTSWDNCWCFHLLVVVHGSPNEQYGDNDDTAWLFRPLTTNGGSPLSIWNFFQYFSDSCHRNGFFLKKRSKSEKN